MKKHLVLAGNIGAGKSTLVSLLSELLGYQPYYEPVAENPYLADFYADMERWAFQSQIFFLSHRIRTHRCLMDDPRSVVQDRSVYEDAEIFARNLHAQGSMADRDWKTYYSLYRALIGLLPAPDLVVYLKASVPTLKKRIALRGREMEAAIPDYYLEGLNRLYEDWIGRFDLCPILVVPCDRLDFVAESGDLASIAREIEARLRDRQGLLFPADMGAVREKKVAVRL
ncbi:MAG: deoxynucleoside kinase [Treponema sp. GWB1_62_6]|nr:MAG: deoxynucleoside kinase [Treponema sp. GWB1_62_6]OHE69941.1 MAG: deoxynucleoside kinase [Treponema sp. GWC1_61_84]OHE70567.1 MAG: deoxynucleoside kinase [Treponema sp. RIFOXYC1_FULL_61_9]HCM26904.1 deoxynucleoside kinase [Treponema sp.]